MAPAFAAESDTNWHQNSYQPSSGGGCDWQCATSGHSTIVNGQLNLGTVWSKVNADVHNVEGDVNLQATAAGNTAEIVTMDDTHVDNTQVDRADVGATLNTNVDNVDGYVNLGASTACNSVDVSTDPTVTAVNNTQFCGAADPEATVNANVRNAGGVGINATAVGNQFTTDSNATRFPVTTFQQNNGAVVANVNAGVRNVGPVDVSAAAVGNSAQIVHYSTGQ
jgi:hypothetical protein